MPTWTPICAGEATTARMPHLEMATHCPPGPSDITQVHQAGGRALPSEYRAYTTEKRPHDDPEAQNLAKGIEKEQKWWRSHYTHADLPKTCANNNYLAREVATARMPHLGVVMGHRPGHEDDIPRHAVGGRAPPSERDHWGLGEVRVP